MEGVILSTWDHIMGPQIEKLWLVDETSQKKVSEVPVKDLRDFNVSKRIIGAKSSDPCVMETYAAMCGQLLLGEVDTCRTVGEWPSRIYISENKILLAIMFHLNTWNSPSSNKSLKDVCLCFGTLFKIFEHNIILHGHLSIDHQLRKVVSAFMNSKFSVASCSENVIALVEDITEFMSSAKKLRLDDMIAIVPFQLLLKPDFSYLSCGIVSHLQTSGNTVVIGDSFFIQEVIYFLLKFSCPTKPNSSCKNSWSSKSAITGTSIPFTNKANKNSKFLFRRINKELGPLTVIDIVMGKVWKADFGANFKTGKIEDSLYPVNETGHLVPELLSDIMFIETNKGDCRKHIEEFKLGLMTKSSALIKSIDHSRKLGKLLSKKELMCMFSIRTLVDLEILIGCAENIKPGIRSILVA